MQFSLVLVRWITFGLLVGVASGISSAFFLWLLNLATDWRLQEPRLLLLLPLCGPLIAWLYSGANRVALGGNNLILEQIHQPGQRVPLRMAPLVLVTTVLTHLCGGSAGREGTAVQMGGSLADGLGRAFRLGKEDRRLLLAAGISGGFGAVFGTPLAGMVFGLEVLTIGRIRYDALLPCLVAALVGDWTCQGLGIHHHHYAAPSGFVFQLSALPWIVLAGMAFGAAATVFIELTHFLSRLGSSLPRAEFLRPLLGGLVVLLFTALVGNQDYNGLSIPLIERAFWATDLPWYAFLLKILFTSITLGAGFKGGEVTPLFCIGATLGSALGTFTGQDPAFFAVLGFVAVFSGAANTPLACTLMGIELFGAEFGVPLAIVCVLSYLASGHRGIYKSQPVGEVKTGHSLKESEAKG